MVSRVAEVLEGEEETHPVSDSQTSGKGVHRRRIGSKVSLENCGYLRRKRETDRSMVKQRNRTYRHGGETSGQGNVKNRSHQGVEEETFNHVGKTQGALKEPL